MAVGALEKSLRVVWGSVFKISDTLLVPCLFQALKCEEMLVLAIYKQGLQSVLILYSPCRKAVLGQQHSDSALLAPSSQAAIGSVW